MDTVMTLLTLLAVTVGTLVLCIGAIRVLDRVLFPGVPFGRALGDGNLAVAVFLGAVALGIFLLASRTMAAAPDTYDQDFRQWGRYHFGYSVDWNTSRRRAWRRAGSTPPCAAM